LILGIGSRACAIPIAHVAETMRPLRVEPIAGMAPFLLGLAVIRGTPVPVVDLRALVGESQPETISRFVVLKVGDRRVALAVGTVVGIRDLDLIAPVDTPPLLRGARAEVVDAIGVLDAQLLLVLRASRLLPEDTWRQLSAREIPS
jgi:purine-binding chemotaxis protein CheW